ncbi:RNA polymerase sigma-70 factor [soil metagenome]
MAILYTDNELFQLIAQENEAAFSELFRRYDKRIYPFVLKMIKDKTLAEEITQEIFIKIWSNREKLTIIDQPEAYILTISARHTLDYIKKRLNENKKLQRLSVIFRDSSSNETEDTLLLRDSAALIQAAVNKLPPQQKAVYELSRQQGLKYDEIALQLNISQNTVRNHLVKALATIREYINEHNKLPIYLVSCLLLLKHS